VWFGSQGKGNGCSLLDKRGNICRLYSHFIWHRHYLFSG